MRSLKIILLCCTALGGVSAFAANLATDDKAASGASRPVAAGAGAPAPVDRTKYEKALSLLKKNTTALKQVNAEKATLQGALDAARGEADALRGALEAARAEADKIRGAAARANEGQLAGILSKKAVLEAEVADLAEANDAYVAMEADIKAALLGIAGKSEVDAEEVSASDAVDLVRDLVAGQKANIASVKAGLLGIAASSGAGVADVSVSDAVDLIKHLFQHQQFVLARTKANYDEAIREAETRIGMLNAALGTEKEKVRNAFSSKSAPTGCGAGAGAGVHRDSVDKEKVYRQKVKEACALLGVSLKDSEETIKDAFHKLARKQHPDKDKSAEATAKMQELSAARDLVLEFREMYGR